MFSRLWFGLAVLLVVSPSINAEGLIYQLPPDGGWARFEMDGKSVQSSGRETTMVGTVTISSVGVTEVDGKKCRWIEFVSDVKRNGVAFQEVDKFLIPEEHLGRGKEPLKHVLKYWLRNSQVNGGKPREVEDLAEGGALRLQEQESRLHGPYAEVSEIEVAAIESKLGKLKCKGICVSKLMGRVQGGTSTSALIIRLHEKAPFGVVASEETTTVENDGKPLINASVTLKLADFGTDAKSLIPEAK